MNQTALLSRRQVAEYLGLSTQTLAAWASQGRADLPYVRLGRCVRYRLEDVEAFVAASRVGTCSSPLNLSAKPSQA